MILVDTYLGAKPRKAKRVIERFAGYTLDFLFFFSVYNFIINLLKYMNLSYDIVVINVLLINKIMYLTVFIVTVCIGRK